MSDNGSLITRYRPSDWDEVVGNGRAIDHLQRAIAATSSMPHSFLFTGPSGTGKTTLARIVGKELKADVVEIDAASNAGVADARQIVEFGEHASLHGDGRRLIIIDECHSLSKSAWQALLKILEEPPRHLFFALCTTELDKIIETVRQRCYHCVLKPVSREDIRDLIDAIIDAEHMQVVPDVLQMILQECNGSPRKALSLLQVAHDAPNKAEAQRIISLQDASDPLRELLQLFVRGKPGWAPVRDLLIKIKEQDTFEDSVMQAGGYMSAVLVNQEDEKRARAIWQLLDALLFPVTTFDRKQQFIAAVGRMMWGG